MMDIVSSRLADGIVMEL